MKGFGRIELNYKTLKSELDEFEAFLNGSMHKKERREIAPFFRDHEQLVAALGFTHPEIQHPDCVSTELSLFGDFACDSASGDSESKAFLLIEFEDATEHSVLRRIKEGDEGKIKAWSSRFEHGFSQLVDWAWRLDTEAPGSPSMQRIFGVDNPSLHFLLIAGRSSDLTEADQNRMLWRARSVHFGKYRMSCLTFDGVLATLRRRLSLAETVDS